MARITGTYRAFHPAVPDVDGTPQSSLDRRTRAYDVYDSQGAHVGQATLPVHSRIVGCGAGVAYIARTDPTDDQVYLERHRLKS